MPGSAIVSTSGTGSVTISFVVGFVAGTASGIGSQVAGVSSSGFVLFLPVWWSRLFSCISIRSRS